MSSPNIPHSHSKPHSYSKSSKYDTIDPVDEERKGLLSGVDESDSDVDSSPHKPWSRKKVAGTALFLIGLIIGGSFARSFLLMSPRRTHPNLHFDGDVLRSNGTHDFRRTVLIVSIDGLRCLIFFVFAFGEATH